jgi:DNA/RNA endonuclease YhcR with UshA esterase domain
MVRIASILLLIGAVWLTSLPLAAHHSISAEFDQSKPVNFTGTIKKVEWMNPHIYTHVEVKNPDGSLTVYKVEGGPPNALFRQGWRRDTLKVGDTVTVTGIRAKIPTSMNVGVATITTADGKRVFSGAGGTGRAAGAQ